MRGHSSVIGGGVMLTDGMFMIPHDKVDEPRGVSDERQEYLRRRVVLVRGAHSTSRQAEQPARKQQQHNTQAGVGGHRFGGVTTPSIIYLRLNSRYDESS